MKHTNKLHKLSFFICLMAFTLLIVPAQAQQDVTPPELVEFSFTPTSIDVSSSPQNVTVTLRVTDDLSGVSSANVQFRSPSGQQYRAGNMSSSDRISGDAQDGVYEGPVDFPPFSEAGTWYVSYVTVHDNVGNTRDFYTANLVNMGFPTELEVTSVQDVTSPQLIEFSFTPTSIDVSASPQNVTVTLRVTDDLSGVSSANVQFRSPSGQQYTAGNMSSSDRISGDAQDGVYEGPVDFPQFSEAGTWHVSYVTVHDNAGNTRDFYTADLINMGFPTELVVTIVIQVDIDIKPGSYPNTINLGSEGVVPVAILGSTTFDVTTVDQTTLELEGSHARVKGKSGNIGSFDDVNNDGFVDLVVQFPVDELNLTETDVEATLTGTLLDETPIEGTDDICIVPASTSKRVLNSGEESAPKVYSLAQNYPNPFNPETEIRFQLPEAGHVVVKIFNTVGAEIRMLVEASYEAGYHRVRWNGKDSNGNPVVSGVYLYQLRAENFSQVKKMSLLR